jgi:sterol desaturase/sphingolipid hydroxylase (fatty acid hydroxylase superfamily)
MLINTAMLRLAFPILATGWAVWCSTNGVGVLNLWALPSVPAILVGVLCLDLALYWQHRFFHQTPSLWRLHRVHHSDLAFDVTLGVRFHPLEIALSMAIKLGVIALAGAPAVAVLIFEILLSAGSLFTHADVDLPQDVERRLRWLVITPDMHRVHHSVYREETDSNYGFHLSVWDHIFGSYRASPRDGHLAMSIGLPVYRSIEEQRLLALLTNPFGE